MSNANVDAFKRGLEAGNRGDVDGLLDELHPEMEGKTISIRAFLNREEALEAAGLSE